MAGAYFVLFPKSNFDLEIYVFRFHVKTVPARTHGAVGAWFGEQVLLGILTQAMHFSSVAFWAHVGGFGVGVILAVLFTVMVPAKARRQRDATDSWYMQDTYNQDQDEVTQLKL